jgi:hypothetical protein
MNTTPEWKLVPVVPTEEMCRAVGNFCGPCDTEEQIYRAMVNAAPVPPAASAGLVEAVLDMIEHFERVDADAKSKAVIAKVCAELAAHDAAAEQPTPSEGCMLHATLSEHATLQPAPVMDLPEPFGLSIGDLRDEQGHVRESFYERYMPDNGHKQRLYTAEQMISHREEFARAAVAADRAWLDVFADGSPAQKAFWEGYESCVRDDGGRPGNIRQRWNQYRERARLAGQKGVTK